jgi:hypothetical protein
VVYISGTGDGVDIGAEEKEVHKYIHDLSWEMVSDCGRDSWEKRTACENIDEDGKSHKSSRKQ